jgi:hypothetical protein
VTTTGATVSPISSVCRPVLVRVAMVLALAVVAASPGVAPAQTAAAREDGVRWRELTPAQRAALAPLEREWPTIDGPRKQKWLEIAGRYPSLPAAEQSRLQARMAEWARMSPAERGQARLNFQQAREVPSADRQARWEAYQALPAEQRRQLAERAAPPTPAPAKPRGATAFAAPPRAVAPTVVQAKPGATTKLISDRGAPPPHQQTGLPKIAASPGFVDSSTLLPQRGPQGAAVSATPERDKPERAKPTTKQP